MENETEKEQHEKTPYLDSKQVYEVLKAKGIVNFHHANTVKTSLTFIAARALLSRGYVESHKLDQTEQYTDKKDKELGIWDSVFLDGLDLHKKYVTRNKYGPILFHIDLDMLLHKEFSKVRVTRSNPDSWQSPAGNLYENVADIEKEYLTGNKLKDGRIMFLFGQPETTVSLQRFCKKIIVDDPRCSFIYSDGEERFISEMVKLMLEKALMQ